MSASQDGHSRHKQIEVGDLVEYASFGARRVVAVKPHIPGLCGQSVCIDTTGLNVWGGWVWVPDKPSRLSARRAS